MKAKFVFLLISVCILCSCNEQKKMSSIDPVNWKKRTVTKMPTDSLLKGESYLSVYSQIFTQTEEVINNLTATVSIANTDRNDTIYIDKAAYFNTKGQLIRTYFDKTIYLAPMETVQIVIDQLDEEGGTGANFIFDWQTKKETNEPYFEAVMISTYSQQGISFTTQGKRLRKK